MEQNKNLASQRTDVFSIVDLEFRKVEVQRHIRIKMQEIDESELEAKTVKHQLGMEQR